MKLNLALMALLCLFTGCGSPEGDFRRFGGPALSYLLSQPTPRSNEQLSNATGKVPGKWQISDVQRECHGTGFADIPCKGTISFAYAFIPDPPAQIPTHVFDENGKMVRASGRAIAGYDYIGKKWTRQADDFPDLRPTIKALFP